MGAHPSRKEKKRKDYAFRHQFDEKPSVLLGCPGARPSAACFVERRPDHCWQIKGKLTSCAIATLQQKLERYAAEHQAWSALLVGKGR